MPQRRIIESHTHDVSARFSAAGERMVIFTIQSLGEQDPPVYAFKPDQARELARRVLEMADVVDALDASP
jgi:hypothetical protein